MCTSASRAAEGKQPRIEKAGAIEVTLSDGTLFRYLQDAGGVYDIYNREPSGSPRYLPSEIDSLKTLYRRLQKAEGASIKVLSGKKAHQMEMDAVKSFTGTYGEVTREMRKTARKQHLNDRAQKRNKKA